MTLTPGGLEGAMAQAHARGNWVMYDPGPSFPAPKAPAGPEFYSGLDLGQAQDPSALSVLERKMGPDPAGPERPGVAHYALRHLKRWPLGTSYVDIVADVKKLFEGPPLAGSTLCADGTGVGRPVVDMLRKAGINCRLRCIIITFGHGSRPDVRGGYRVAKVELVGALQVLLQSRRLKVAEALPEAKTLVKELQNFRVKITPATNEIFESYREGLNDDLVLATSMPAWLAERGRRAEVY